MKHVVDVNSENKNSLSSPLYSLYTPLTHNDNREMLRLIEMYLTYWLDSLPVTSYVVYKDNEYTPRTIMNKNVLPQRTIYHISCPTSEDILYLQLCGIPPPLEHVFSLH